MIGWGWVHLLVTVAHCVTEHASALHLDRLTVMQQYVGAKCEKGTVYRCFCTAVCRLCVHSTAALNQSDELSV